MRAVGFVRSLILAVSVVAIGGCDVGTFGEAPDGGDGTPLPLTFDGQISQDLALCVACHGAVDPEGGYRTDSYAALLAAVVPNDPAASEIIIQMTTPVIEVDHEPYATPARLQLLTDWINAGAPEL